MQVGVDPINPYREPWPPDPARRDPAPRVGGEDLAISLIALVTGGVRVVPAVVRGESFGLGATVALIFFLFGLLGLLRAVILRR
jgi:hypothetical protein